MSKPYELFPSPTWMPNASGTEGAKGPAAWRAAMDLNAAAGKEGMRAPQAAPFVAAATPASSQRKPYEIFPSDAPQATTPPFGRVSGGGYPERPLRGKKPYEIFPESFPQAPAATTPPATTGTQYFAGRALKPYEMIPPEWTSERPPWETGGGLQTQLPERGGCAEKPCGCAGCERAPSTFGPADYARIGPHTSSYGTILCGDYLQLLENFDREIQRRFDTFGPRGRELQRLREVARRVCRAQSRESLCGFFAILQTMTGDVNRNRDLYNAIISLGLACGQSENVVSTATIRANGCTLMNAMVSRIQRQIIDESGVSPIYDYDTHIEPLVQQRDRVAEAYNLCQAQRPVETSGWFAYGVCVAACLTAAGVSYVLCTRSCDMRYPPGSWRDGCYREYCDPILDNAPAQCASYCSPYLSSR